MMPIASVTWFLTCGVQIMSKSEMKCFETAVNASLGHLSNQLIVHPDINPGNFNVRLRNLSPTWEWIYQHHYEDIKRFIRSINLSYILPVKSREQRGGWIWLSIQSSRKDCRCSVLSLDVLSSWLEPILALFHPSPPLETGWISFKHCTH